MSVLIRFRNWLAKGSMFFVLSMMFGGIVAAQPPLRIEKLSSRINSAKYDETNPIVSKDGKTLYFTRVGHPGFKRTLYQDGIELSGRMKVKDYESLLQSVYEEITEESNHNPNTSPFNQDIWIAHSIDGEFDVIEHPEHPVNNALPNSVCSLTPNPNEVIIVNEFYGDGSMYKGFSLLKKDSDGTWHSPQPLHIYEMDGYGSEVNLNMSSDGEIIIFSFDRKDSHGSNDLYVSFKISEKKWSAPTNLGSDINTRYRETTPFLASDNKTLYFASNRPGGMGGSDIYVSRRVDQSWTRWTNPEVLGSPINSEYDDAQPFLNEKSGYLYFSSVREGDSNIYRVREENVLVNLTWDESKPEKKSPIEQESNFTAGILDMDFPNPNSPQEQPSIVRKAFHIHCSLINSKTGQLIDGKIKFASLKDKEVSDEIITTHGEGSLKVYSNDYIRVLPEVKGYIVNEQILHLKGYQEKGLEEHTLLFFLDPIEENTLISLKPIYFERSKATVLESSYAELDRLYQTLNRHKNIEILISGHTDHVGDIELLITLSRERAEAIKAYLTKKGIDSQRIQTEGHGPNKPIEQGIDENIRSKNRRVEVTIYKVN